MVSPEFMPPAENDYLTLSTEVDIEPKVHLTIQALMLSAAESFNNKNFLPNQRDVTYKDIELRAGIPLSFQKKLGAGYREMDFRLIQTPGAGTDPAVSLVLKNSDLGRDVQIMTDQQSATNSRDKQFWVAFAGESASDYLHGEDVYQLFDAVLRTDERLSKLIDPRQQNATAFDGIVSDMEQALRKRTSNVVETRSFATESYDFAIFGNTFIPFENGACLQVTKANNLARHSLDVHGLYNIELNPRDRPAQVIKRLQYAYERHGFTNVYNLSATMSLTSKDLSRADLAAHLFAEGGPSVEIIAHKGIKMISNSHSSEV
jgi:hypothetical protein